MRWFARFASNPAKVDDCGLNVLRKLLPSIDNSAEQRVNRRQVEPLRAVSFLPISCQRFGRLPKLFAHNMVRESGLLFRFPPPPLSSGLGDQYPRAAGICGALRATPRGQSNGVWFDHALRPRKPVSFSAREQRDGCARLADARLPRSPGSAIATCRIVASCNHPLLQLSPALEYALLRTAVGRNPCS